MVGTTDIINAGLFIVLGSVIFTDFQGRYITLPQITALFGLGIAKSMNEYSLTESSQIVLFNSLLTLLLVGSTAFYFRVVRGTESFLDQYFGKGDLLFLLAITPLFPEYEFLPFILSGLLITLLGSFLIGRLFVIKNGIPLAGWFSGAIICIGFLSDKMNLNLSSVVVHHPSFHA